jgi:hypothetical protein
MPPSDHDTNAGVDRMAQYVSGPVPPTDSDLCDWSKGHTITDWPLMLLNDAIIIAGVGLVVWVILRKRK